MATSPGPRGGASVLNLAKTTFPYFGAKMVATFSLPGFYKIFTVEDNITNAAFANELKAN